MNPDVLNALAEPTRLRIIELLREQPYSVNEIADSLGVSQPQASKHLKYLLKAKVVVMQPSAQHRIYSLNPEPFVQLDDWLNSFERYWNNKFTNLDNYLKSKKG